MDQHHSLFTQHQAAAPTGPSPQIVSQLSSISRRLKILEEQVESLRKKEQINEQNNLEHLKKQQATIKAFGQEIDEMKSKLRSMHDDTRLIIEELQTMAKSEDLKVLQKYIDLWNPVKFVTTKDVEQIVKENMRQILKKLNLTAPATTPEPDNRLINPNTTQIQHE